MVTGFGIGKIELSVPGNLPVRPISVPTNVVAKSSPLGVTVTWSDVYGAIGYDIQVRILGQQEWSIYPLGFNRYDTTWTVDGVIWEYAVRTSNGIAVKSAWSGVVSAVAHPMTPSSPINSMFMLNSSWPCHFIATIYIGIVGPFSISLSLTV